MSRLIGSVLAVAAAFAPFHPATSAGCDPAQTADFSIGDFDDGVTDLAILGDALFAAGPFTSADRLRAGGVARWDVDHWTPLGPGQSRTITSLVNHNNQLTASGVFDNDTMTPILGVARWDGTRWNSIPGAPGIVHARLLSTGNTLYAVGLYEAGHGLGPVASWNGTTWTRFPVLKNMVSDAVVHHGSLYVGGFFGPGIDDESPSKIAKWDGSAWTSMNWTGVEVLALASHNQTLFAGTDAASGNLLWQYDGTNWTAIPSITEKGAINRLVSTPAGLLALGTFTSLNDQPLAGAALWNGTTWQSYADGIVSDPKCGVVWRGDLVVGGWLQLAGESRLNNIAWWNGSRWSSFSAPGNGINGRWPTATGHNSELAVAAWNAGFGDASGRGAASWSGTQWNSLDLGEHALIKRLESANGSLYAAGYINDVSGGFLSIPIIERGNDEWMNSSFDLAGGAFDVAATDHGVAVVGSMFSIASGLGMQIVEFGKNAWTPLADSGDGYVERIQRWRDNLVIAGSFKSVDGVNARNIAMRSNGTWQPLGDGLDGRITALASFAGNLYAAIEGSTGESDIQNAEVYRYLNGQWTPIPGPFGDKVLTMAVYDGRLYAGANMYTANGGFAKTLFRLENNAFVPLEIQPDGEVSSLAVSDAHGSQSLYILGNFSFFGDRPSVRIAEYTTCPCPGDVNHDGFVNASDLSVLLARFGRRTDNAYDSGDLTGDRVISSGDLSVLLQRFGAGCG